MKVKKLFRFPGSTTHCVIKSIDGIYYEFRSTPARHVIEADLQPLPGYQEKGNQAEEAPDYMYRMYGLEKEG